MPRYVLHVLTSISLSTAMLGCGGDDDGGSPAPAVSIGLPASQKLSQVEASQAPMVCEAVRQGFEQAASEPQIERLGCTFAALVQSITPSADGKTANVDVNKCEMLVDK